MSLFFLLMLCLSIKSITACSSYVKVRYLWTIVIKAALKTSPPNPTKIEMILPTFVIGYMSPYPTVRTVIRINQIV